MIDEAGCDLHDVTATLLLHLDNGSLSHTKEGREVHPDHCGIISLAVLGERLADEDTCIVHQGIDATEALHCRTDHAFGDDLVSDVSRHHQNVVVSGWLHRTCGGNHTEVQVTVSRDKSGTDPLRGASDYSYLLL